MTWTNRALLILGALILAGALLYLRLQRHEISVSDARRAGAVGCSQVAVGYGEQESGVWLTVSAMVVRLLPDTYGRLQHQRFLVRCPSGQTILIVNDVSVGQRVPVSAGQRVVVRGQYVWNPQGGLIHFTHHDGGDGGWILYHDHVYALVAGALSRA